MVTEGWSAAALERSRYCVQWMEVEAGDTGEQVAMMRGCGNSGDDGKALDAGCVECGRRDGDEKRSGAGVADQKESELASGMRDDR